MSTLLPFLVAQIPRLFGLKTEGHFFIAIAAVISTLGLFAYCTYQVRYRMHSKGFLPEAN